MKKLKTTLFLLLLPIFLFAQSEESPFVTVWEQLESGKTYEVFGNNIKLREAPNSDAEVLELLPLGSKIKLLEKTEQTIEWNGGETHWWKVECGGKQGYTIEGLIADASVNAVNSDSTVFVFKTDRGDNRKIQVKAYKGLELIHSIQFVPIGEQFSFTVRATGFADIKDIIAIDYYSEACGMEGGETLIFWDDSKMYHVADLRSMGDGGELHIDEKVIFPFEEGNYHDDNSIIVFSSESGEMVNHETGHYKTIIDTKKLVWQGDKFYPDIMRKQGEN